MAQKNICFNIFTEETDPPHYFFIYESQFFFNPTMWQVYALGIQHLPKVVILGTYGTLELSILGPWGYSQNPYFIGEKFKTQRGELTCFSQLLQPFGIKAEETSFLIPLFSIKKSGLFIKHVCL